MTSSYAVHSTDQLRGEVKKWFYLVLEARIGPVRLDAMNAMLFGDFGVKNLSTNGIYLWNGVFEYWIFQETSCTFSINV